MLLVTDYPLLDVFWSMLIFFLWVAWFFILFRCIADIFRRHDIGGGMKVLWMIFLIVAPFLGVFVYVIAENRGMQERDLERVKAQQQQFDQYVRETAASSGGGAGGAHEIEKAKQLLDSGAITQAEYEALKAKALG
jgi:hypothetical protein